ncbi:hypothetical protein PAQ31011_04299 [Pandoraea aquatica]|uniref:Uncharacterized protein n=1 Tax=Pandoraea aquatica TaxID=2508290 RepID=A0A5E4Y4F7_9BURK|nr:hypothetical protein [Pandoraea aquatica]VVE43526.1 hypothetical protein PAQ31011_04299 [Pandoraea aquatica]
MFAAALPPYTPPVCPAFTPFTLPLSNDMCPAGPRFDEQFTGLRNRYDNAVSNILHADGTLTPIKLSRAIALYGTASDRKTTMMLGVLAHVTRERWDAVHEQSVVDRISGHLSKMSEALAAEKMQDFVDAVNCGKQEKTVNELLNRYFPQSDRAAARRTGTASACAPVVPKSEITIVKSCPEAHAQQTQSTLTSAARAVIGTGVNYVAGVATGFAASALIMAKNFQYAGSGHDWRAAEAAQVNEAERQRERFRAALAEIA